MLNQLLVFLKVTTIKKKSFNTLTIVLSECTMAQTHMSSTQTHTHTKLECSYQTQAVFVHLFDFFCGGLVLFDLGNNIPNHHFLHVHKLGYKF